jgi:hypothetical protein
MLFYFKKTKHLLSIVVFIIIKQTIMSIPFRFLLLFIFLGNIAQAQFITLSDTNFRNQLIAQYPSCFNTAKDLDTICAQNATDTSIILANNLMQNIDGIHYFSALKDIFLSNCSALTTLPNLPSINKLGINYCGVTTLQNLPNTIKTIESYFTPISSINAWPTSVENITMLYSSLSSIPALPSGLKNLIINNAGLSSIPTLPSGLVTLEMHYNSITNLPTLPNSLLLICIVIKFLQCLFYLLQLPT